MPCQNGDVCAGALTVQGMADLLVRPTRRAFFRGQLRNASVLLMALAVTGCSSAPASISKDMAASKFVAGEVKEFLAGAGYELRPLVSEPCGYGFDCVDANYRVTVSHDSPTDLLDVTVGCSALAAVGEEFGVTGWSSEAPGGEAVRAWGPSSGFASTCAEVLGAVYQDPGGVEGNGSTARVFVTATHRLDGRDIPMLLSLQRYDSGGVSELRVEASTTFGE